MTTVIEVLLILSIVGPFGAYFLGFSKSPRKMLYVNLATFFGILLLTGIGLGANIVSAASVATSAADATVKSMGYIAAAGVTGLAAIGAGIAVAASASAALGAISENEKIMGKALIFVALAEGIALYGLLVSFSILGRI